jgi:hypothetical protein
MNSTPICPYVVPTSVSLRPPKFVEPILAPSYNLHPCLIKMIRNLPFLGEGNKNSYLHLQEFERTCACLHIAGMSNKTLRWKLFSSSLMEIAKQWYDLTVESMQGDWETLCSKFYLRFFPISKVVSLRKEILNLVHHGIIFMNLS